MVNPQKCFSICCLFIRGLHFYYSLFTRIQGETPIALQFIYAHISVQCGSRYCFFVHSHSISECAWYYTLVKIRKKSHTGCAGGHYYPSMPTSRQCHSQSKQADFVRILYHQQMPCSVTGGVVCGMGSWWTGSHDRGYWISDIKKKAMEEFKMHFYELRTRTTKWR